MKPFTLFITCALMLAGAASMRADVLIYDYRSSAKIIGDGLETSASRRGYMVWNLEDNRLTWLYYYSRNGSKRYSTSSGVPVVVSVTGKSNRQYTTYSGAGENDGQYFMEFTRGLNKLLRHHSALYTQFPRTFKGTGHALDTVTGPGLIDETHSAVYSPKRTIAANDAGRTQEDVVTALRAELEAKGYVDVSSASASAGSISTSSTSFFSRASPPAPRNTTLGRGHQRREQE